MTHSPNNLSANTSLVEHIVTALVPDYRDTETRDRIRSSIIGNPNSVSINSTKESHVVVSQLEVDVHLPEEVMKDRKVSVPTYILES